MRNIYSLYKNKKRSRCNKNKKYQYKKNKIDKKARQADKRTR